MKFYFVLKNMYPIGKASTARIRSYAKGLNKYNVEKQVLIPISPERFGQSPINKEKEGIFDDTYYLYLSGSPQRKSNVLLRKLNDFYGYIKTLQYLYQHVKKEILQSYTKEEYYGMLYVR